MSLNKVILVGRLGRDPETRNTAGGQTVCNFTLATDETFKDRNGERQKKTTWHNIVVWGKQAETAQQYLHKGDLTCVEGKIQIREWEDKDGGKRQTLEIVLTNLQLLPNRPAEGSGAQQARPAARSVQQARPTQTRSAQQSRPQQARPQQARPAPPPAQEPERFEDVSTEIDDSDIPF